MQINNIKIGGFKNIDNINIEITNITSLLSVNSYGKSNTLRGLEFGINFIHMPFKKELMNSESNKPLNNKILLKDFTFEIELTHKEDKIQYGYTFRWNSQKNESAIKSEYLKIKNKSSQKYTAYIERIENESTYKPSKNSSCNKKIKIENDNLIINKLLAFDDLYYIEIIKEINNITIFVDNSSNTNLEFKMRKQIRSINIPETLYRIKSNYPSKYELITNTLKDIFPFIKDIEVKEIEINSTIDRKNRIIYESDKTYFLIVYDKNLAKPLDFRNMSDGVKRILITFIILTLADMNNNLLIGIEEPENSLNPKILQRYLMTLKSFTTKTKIIITSHSPHLINYFEPKNIYIGLPNEEGLAIFSKIKDTSINKLSKDASEMDLQIGDYLFDLMSGTTEDIETLLKYTE